MNWWNALPEYWRGFITGGVVIPLSIVAIECAVKFVVHGKIFWK